MEVLFLLFIYKFILIITRYYATVDETLTGAIRNDREKMIHRNSYWFIALLAIAIGMILMAGCTSIQTTDDKVFLEKAQNHITAINTTLNDLVSSMNDMEIGASISNADELKTRVDAAKADLSNITVSPPRQQYKDELIMAFSNMSTGASSVNESLTFLLAGNQDEAMRISEEGGPHMDEGIAHLEKAKSLL